MNHLIQGLFSGVCPLSIAKVTPNHLFYHSNEIQMERRFILDLAGLDVVVVPPEEICLFAGLFTEQSFNFSKDFFLLWERIDSGVTREGL